MLNQTMTWNDVGAVTDATPLSPWWSPVAAFKHDAGLVQRLKIAEANGVSMRG